MRLFHAKVNRDAFLPRHEQARAHVLRGLDLTRRLYLAVVESHLGSRRLAGGFTSYAARVMAGSVFDPLHVVVTADESPVDADVPVASPSGAPTVLLPHIESADYTVAFQARKLAWADAAELAHLPFIRRAVGTNADGEAQMAALLQGRLVLGSASRLEVQFGLVLSNARQLRESYA